jgi:hypothetical protein
MRAVPDRRTFVRNVIVAAPAVAGATTLARAAHAFPARPAVNALGITTGIDGVLRQMAALHNELLLRRPTEADARVVAGQIRELIAYRQQSNRDGEISRTFRDLVATQGRRTLVTTEPDRAVLQRALTHYGIHSTRAHDFRPPSTEAREAALETLTMSGATFYYVDPLVLLQTYSQILAENPSFCDYLEAAVEVLEAMVTVLCLGAQFILFIAPECVVASVALAIVQLLEIIYRC